MLKNIFKSLDEWVVEENAQAEASGFPVYRKCEFKILGQTALLEAGLKLELNATVDVDAYTNANYAVTAKFSELLRLNGLELDPLSAEVWMPQETEYILIFKGQFVQAYRANPTYVLVSKAVKSMKKNKSLLIQYLAHSPSDEFFSLCKKYGAKLEKLIAEDK